MLNQILNYQNIDGEIIRLESELANSNERQSAAEIQQTLKNQHSRLVTLENNANRINNNYISAKKKYDEYVSKLDKLKAEVSAADAGSDKLEFFEKTYHDFQAVSTSLEKEITSLYNEIQNTNKEYEEIIRQSKNSREKFDKFKAAYDRQKAQIEPKLAALKSQKAAMEHEIDSTVLAKYRQKCENHVFPVFVPLTDNKCGRCRMQLSASKLSEMAKSKYGLIECENCGRIIYQTTAK